MNFTLLTQYLVLVAVSVEWQACLNVKNTIIFDCVTILFLGFYVTVTVTYKLDLFQQTHSMLAGKERQVSARPSPLLSFLVASSQVLVTEQY